MKKKILVVDDDRDQRDLYVEVFEGKGYEVISANDGLEGLGVALKDTPHLVFTGIIMPRMDGFEFIRNLRNNVTTAHLPVVMFSHLGREEDRERAKLLSGVEFFVKGVDSPATIVKKIEDIIGTSEK